jgi:hypothetical protein
VLLLARYCTGLLSNSKCKYVKMSKHGHAWDRSRASAMRPLSNRLRGGMVDRPGSKFYQYHPPGAEVKNEWRYTASPSILLHSVDMAALDFP